MIFPRFPYTDFHRLNADWILSKMQDALDTVERIADDVDTWSSRILEAQTNASNALTTAGNALTTANNAAQTASGASAMALDVSTNAVRYDVAQTRPAADQTQARNNIGAGSQEDVSSAISTANAAAQLAAGAVRFDAAQTLPWADQTQARENISAVSTDEFSSRTALLSQRIDHLGVTGTYDDANDVLYIGMGPGALYNYTDNALPPAVVVGAGEHGDSFTVYQITKLERSTVNDVYHYTVYIEGPTGSYVGNAVQGDSYITCTVPTP